VVVDPVPGTPNRHWQPGRPGGNRPFGGRRAGWMRRGSTRTADDKNALRSAGYPQACRAWLSTHAVLPSVHRRSAPAGRTENPRRPRAVASPALLLPRKDGRPRPANRAEPVPPFNRALAVCFAPRSPRHHRSRSAAIASVRSYENVFCAWPEGGHFLRGNCKTRPSTPVTKTRRDPRRPEAQGGTETRGYPTTGG